MPEPSKIMTRMRHRLQKLAYSSSLYRLVISGPVPKNLLITPGDPWPGETARARAILDGHFNAGGLRVSAAPPDWLPEGAGPAFIDDVHGFVWLRDLRALGGDAARRAARGLLSNWLDRFGDWSPVVWDPPLIADRLTHLVGLHDFALASADDDFRARVFESMVHQCRHLLRIVPESLAAVMRRDDAPAPAAALPASALPGTALLRTLRGLVFAGESLEDGEKALALALSILPAALRAALHGDGSVRERNPARQILALQCLIDIRQALREAQIALPPELPLAIEKAAAALRFFRAGDGGLALFNGGREENPVMVEALLELSDARSRAPRGLSGYERLQAGRMLVIMDTGAPPPAGLDGEAHAGIAAFELYAGRERLIVNCGAHPSRAPAGSWREALASTAAHSTLSVEDRNSSEILSGGGFGRRAQVLSCMRKAAAGAPVSVQVSHDGYRQSHDLIHARRLILDEHGDRLRGVDILQGPAGARHVLRFHLHPQVQASLTQSGTAVLLRAGSGFFRVTADGLPLALEESVYFGQDEPRRSAQIVFAAATGAGQTEINWTIAREKKG